MTPVKQVAILFSFFGALCTLPGVSARGQVFDPCFTPPDASFWISPTEEVCSVDITGGTVESAQTMIDVARAKKPSAVLLVKLNGTLKVEAAPLRLGSRMCLQFLPGAYLSVSAQGTAPCLISVEQAEFVSVSSVGADAARLDGGDKPLVGIRVRGGSRINLDHLAIIRCGRAGIDYEGHDSQAVNEAGSVTRCHFQGNGDGLRVDRTAAFMCLDNDFQNQTGTALSFRSITGVVAGNTFTGNTVAIQSGSDRAVVARNVFGAGLALDLMPGSEGNLVTENRGMAAGVRLSLAGARHQLFRNTLQGAVSVASGSRDILLIANDGLKTAPVAPGVLLFSPPTWTSPHQDPLIVPGMGRFDFSVPGGGVAKNKINREPPVDLATVQAALSRARVEHPNDMLVLTLRGHYVSRSPEGLQLPPNTCVILDGRIMTDIGTPGDPLPEKDGPLTQVIRLPATGYCSVSGGTIDAGRQVCFPVNASAGSIALLDGVTISSGTHDGIYTKGRRAGDPLFIYRCTVCANRGRGIWAHVATRAHSIANVCSGNTVDGIDLDAYSMDGTALFNVCSGNGRHGVFVEEGIHHNVVFDNNLSGNGGAGVHVWNEEVKRNTGPNVIAANKCIANLRGVSVGARADDKTAHGNVFFNNVCRENRWDGILAGNSHATGNFFSQCVVGRNTENDVKIRAEAGSRFLNQASRSTE